ncbi:MAG: tyrosine-type recombinase/integrase [Prosthecobacter sp.]|nr:tyrosine-type recombinase/integrase [Prosthecobacter sp.]
MSKQKKAEKKAKWPKSDTRHWQGRLFKNSFTRDGSREETADWCVKIGHKGRRETFNLTTPNAEAAAGKALRIYRIVIGAGWEAARAEFKPKSVTVAKAATLGAWLEAVKATAEIKPATLTTYGQCLRQIAAEIESIGDQPALGEDGKPKKDRKGRAIHLSRFDYRTGGRNAWTAKVDALPLSVLSAASVQRWKLEYIARAGNAPDARRRAENSAATLIRCARSLFSAKARKYAGAELILPDPLPFVGVELPKKGNTTYQSKIDAATLIAKARQELIGEPFKIFILGLLCGLRKREIDLLTWGQVDFGKSLIRIELTEHFQTKSEDSAGEVDLDPETLALLRGWKANATGAFVIESKRPPRHDASRTNYRCTPHFKALYVWLKEQGVTARKPLHELRKELGAVLASTHGIFAAQSVLRHAQISTTAAYYTDKKRRITAGFGAWLSPAPGNIVKATFTKAEQKAKQAKGKASA